MSIMLEANVLVVRDESNRFYPTASEIFSVLFEGAQSIRGIEACSREFQECGIKFHEYLAELLIVVEYAPGPDGPEILLDLRARLGEIEAFVPHADGNYLDYAIGKGHWLPLPPDSPEAANVTLGELGLVEFGSITLAQYMKLARCQGNGINILDRTADAFSAQKCCGHFGRDASNGSCRKTL
jgi:hypothetical protein